METLNPVVCNKINESEFRAGGHHFPTGPIGQVIENLYIGSALKRASIWFDIRDVKSHVNAIICTFSLDILFNSVPLWLRILK